MSVVWGGSIAVLMIALGVPAPEAALPLSPPNGSWVGQTQDNRAREVGRMVGGLISYARWPAPHSTFMICTMGTTSLAQRLGDAAAIARSSVTTRAIAPGSAAAQQGCDVLYLGSTTPAQRQKAIMAIHGQPVLSIAEAGVDPDCRAGTMFCLIAGNRSLTFRLNIDAVSRSTVRIDPRVLRMFADGAETS